MSWISALLVVIQIIGKFVDRLDAADKARVQRALIDAARVKLEDEVIADAAAAYDAAVPIDLSVVRDADRYRID